MLIFRVENSKGGGMYWGNDEAFSYEMIDAMRHPIPDKDSALSPFWSKLTSIDKENYHFGFGSLEQLKNWIYQNSWREEINAAGFRIYVYESQHYAIGDTQAVFRKNLATLQYSLSLLEI